MSKYYYHFKPKFLYIFIALFLLLSQTVSAQGTGIIKGHVADKLTGDPLVGANVIVAQTNLGAASDLEGNFRIPKVSAGTRQIVISYIGYQSKTVEVSVAANKLTELNVELEPEAVEGEVVLVKAQAKGQLEAINQQLSSNSIINVVSAEKMRELPDANLAESIGRLPGISLQRSSGEAEKVVIRGLSPKFNNVTIEGVPMVSTNDYDRSIDLSLISDDIVQGVEVSKSLRADMDADALGGTVNLRLKKASEGLHYNVTGMGGYNDLKSDWNNYKFSGSVSNRYFDNRFGLQLSLNAEQKQLPSQQFNASFNPPETYQIIDRVNNDTTNGIRQKTGAVNLTENDTKRNRYGGTLILDYKTDFVELQLLNLYSQKDDKSTARNNWTRFNNTNQEFGFQQYIYVTDTKTEQRTHSLQSLFKLWDTELNISLSYTKGTVKAPDGQRFDFITPSANVNNPFGPNDLWFRQPSEAVTDMGLMSPENSQLSNMYFNDLSLSDETYDTKFDYKVPFKLSDYISGSFSAGGKYHGTKRSSDFEQIIDYMQYGAGSNARIDLVNKFPWIQTVIAHERGIDASNFVNSGYDLSNFLDGRWNIGWAADVDKLTNMQSEYYNNLGGNQIYLQREQGVNNYSQDYNDTEDSYAGYLMGEFNIGRDLTIVPGIRYQDEKTDIKAYHIQIVGANFDGLGAPPVQKEFKRDHPNWFPSINIKYKATDNIQIMGAAYRSLSLPSFREISPLVIYQESSSYPRIISNNPILRPATAWNFDLGATLSGNKAGLFTVNLFYKQINNLVFTFQNYLPFLPDSLLLGEPDDMFDRLPAKDYFSTSWATGNNGLTATTNIPLNNPKDAYIKGIEISWQTNFWYLPGLLSGLVLDLNLTFIKSYTLYPFFEQGRNIGTRLKPVYEYNYATREGEVNDQPKAIYNATIGWDYLGFSSRFSLRYQEKTLTGLDTRYALRDSYYDNVLLIDIALKQRLFDNFAVYANFTNINKHIDDYYLTIPSGEQFPTSQQTYGLRAQFGVSYNF